jgi:hypothetical protein
MSEKPDPTEEKAAEIAKFYGIGDPLFDYMRELHRRRRARSDRTPEAIAEEKSMRKDHARFARASGTWRVMGYDTN